MSDARNTLALRLAPIRLAYVRELARAIASCDAIGEPALRGADGAIGRDGVLQVGLRVDLFDRASSKSLRIGPNALLSADAAELLWSTGTALRVEPFCWSELRVEVVIGAPIGADLAAWFERWFDAEDRHELDPDGLAGVVHFVSDPRDVDGASVFEVDLGSAPVSAVLDLTDVLAGLGAQRIRMRS